MSTLACDGGHVISDVAVPNEVTGSLLSDKSETALFDYIESVIDEFFAQAGAGGVDEWRRRHFSEPYPALSQGSMLHDLIHRRCCELTLSLMECEQCGRLHIQRGARTQHYRAYVPAPGVPEVPHVLGPIDGNS